MRARIQRGVETGADFSYAALQLFSLEKCDEHRFKYLIALKQSAKLIQQEIKRNVFIYKKKKKKESGRRKFCRQNLLEKWRKSCHPFSSHPYIYLNRSSRYKAQSLNLFSF